MAVSTSKDLLNHVGHKTKVVTYEKRSQQSVAIECETCNTVLVGYPPKHVTTSPQTEIIAYVDGGILQEVYSTVPLNVIRVDFDEDAKEGCLVAQFNSKSIEDFGLHERELRDFKKNVLQRFGRKEFNRLDQLTGGLLLDK